MKFIEFFSNVAMPLMILVTIIYGVLERKKVFDIFLKGLKTILYKTNKHKS